MGLMLDKIGGVPEEPGTFHPVPRQGPVPTEQYEGEEDSYAAKANDAEASLDQLQEAVDHHHKTKVLPVSWEKEATTFVSLAPESDDGALWDPVGNVQHYQIFPEHGIQVIDVINRSLQLNETTGFEAYCLGNAMKYILRAGRKEGKFYQDLEKAATYIGFITDPRN